jgi:sRNA-binding protein
MVVAKKPKKTAAKPAAAGKPAAPKKTASKTKAEPVPVVKVSLYTIGDDVSHPMFGEGVVTAIEAAKLTIEFADGVTKQIVDDFVKPSKG